MSLIASPHFLRALRRMSSDKAHSKYSYGSAQPTAETGSIIKIHSSAQWKACFDTSKFSAKLLVICFTAVWCKSCRLMEPTIKEFASKHTHVEFIQIDVDELMDVAGQFRIQVMPTFVLIKKGAVVDKVVGAKKDELKKKIDKHGACHNA